MRQLHRKTRLTFPQNEYPLSTTFINGLGSLRTERFYHRHRNIDQAASLIFLPLWPAEYDVHPFCQSTQRIRNGVAQCEHSSRSVHTACQRLCLDCTIHTKRSMSASTPASKLKRNLDRSKSVNADTVWNPKVIYSPKKDENGLARKQVVQLLPSDIGFAWCEQSFTQCPSNITSFVTEKNLCTERDTPWYPYDNHW